MRTCRATRMLALIGLLLPLGCGGEVPEGLRGAQDGAGGVVTASGPPELAGVYPGSVERFQHPDGFYACDLPQGWTIAQRDASAVVVNPGLRETDSLDALVFISHGELSEEERGVDILELFDKGAADLRQGLGQQGIEVEPGAAKASKVAVGERAGAEVLLKGRTAQGPVSVWCGATVEREYYFAVLAVIVQGKEDRFLPGCKRVFRSLQARVPERNPAIEQALAGSEFRGSRSFGGGGSISSIYAFAGGGRVKKQVLMSGVAGIDIGVSGDTEEWGTYRAVGPLVYLQFRSGQEVARAEAGSGGTIAALLFGNARYPRD